MKRAVFPKMNDHSISPKENELKALSTFFTKSCIVGKWSPDPKTNSAWSKYQIYQLLRSVILNHCYAMPKIYIQNYHNIILHSSKNFLNLVTAKFYLVIFFLILIDLWSIFACLVTQLKDPTLNLNLVKPFTIQSPFSFKYIATPIPEAQYNKLCSMCEHPERCDYPDEFSGYVGALKCLAHNNGQVAFTKVIFTRKFFGVRQISIDNNH